MTNYVLEIVLQSPLTSAAGEGRVGLVDRDVAFDDLGLPILPGRRLKGLWREAYRDVADAWQQCKQVPTPASKIFGDSGQSPGNGDAYIHVASAELQEALSLKQWLEYLQHHKVRKIQSDDVVQHYATVRAQTAIDRHTGAAKENTLRFTRTLKAGLVFRAPVHFGSSNQEWKPNQELINALALGAVALQYMGTARTRGLGEVRCRLCKLDNEKLTDLTPDLNQSSLPSIAGAALTRPTQGVTVQTTTLTYSNPKVPTHILRYRLTLREPTVVPVSDADPNTVVTRQDIPGSHLWGVAAWHYLNQANCKAADPAFRHAFLDGELRFLTAYPETADTQQRLIPIPHSIRKFKDITGTNADAGIEELMDFVERSSDRRPTTRVDRRYAKMNQEGLKTQAVKTERNYHHARALNDRRIGRALGTNTPNGGALFTYEAIQAGQTFQGAVLGLKTHLEQLQTWLPTDTLISLGRSRSAQYGKAEFKWISEVEESSGLVEWDGFTATQKPSERGKCLIITTLSSLIAVNDFGHPEACFPTRELAVALKLNASELTLSSSYTRTEVIGGYNAYLRLPRQQWPAIAAGSVFVFELSGELDKNNKEGLVELEQDGLGLRKEEGYGRVAVNRHGHLGLQTGEQLDDPDKANVRDAPESEDIPKELKKLLQSIIRTRCIAEIQEIAVTVARRIRNVPSNSLLGRLRLLLEQDPDIAVERLNNFRKPAKDGLLDCRINTSRSGISWLPNTLYALLEKVWTEPNTITEKLIGEHTRELLDSADVDSIRQQLVNQLKTDDSKDMCKIFLNHLLTVLYRL